MQWRAATGADLEHAWPIQRDAFRDLTERTWGTWSDDTMREGCAEEWDPATTRMLERDGQIVGWVRVEHHAGHDWLDLVVIAVAQQQQGLGTAVMRRLMSEAQQRGVPLWLSVYRTNAARRLYARLGFAELVRDDVRRFMVYPPTTPLVPPRAPGVDRTEKS